MMGRLGASVAAIALCGAAAFHLASRSLAFVTDYFQSAAPSDLAACRDQYVTAQQPGYVRPDLVERTTTICYQSYSVGFSGVTRTPLWSAEHLTAGSVQSASHMNRVDDFHPDEHIPGRDRSTLEDYRGSGFDRGHMSPSGDMPTPDAQDESFSLANMVPQDHEMNGHLWVDVEQAVRQLARRYGTIYVVTGPIFAAAERESVNGRVSVPTSLYKAVFIPGQGAAAYVAANSAQRSLSIVSAAQLAQMTGVDPFPGLDAAAKARAVDLPLPRANRGRHHRTYRGPMM